MSRRHAIEQFALAFAISAAGIALAITLVWRWECRALAKAVTLGGAA